MIGSDLDTGRVHVDQDKADPFLVFGVGVGTDEAEACGWRTCAPVVQILVPLMT